MSNSKAIVDQFIQNQKDIAFLNSSKEKLRKVSFGFENHTITLNASAVIEEFSDEAALIRVIEGALYSEHNDLLEQGMDCLKKEVMGEMKEEEEEVCNHCKGRGTLTYSDNLSVHEIICEYQKGGKNVV